MRRDHTDKTFILVATIVVLLLLMHLLPEVSIGDITMRRVSILSDISDSPLDKEQPDVIPKPKEPSAEERGLKSKSGKKITFQEIWPDSIQRVVDFSAGGAHGMGHFYAMLDSLVRHRPIGRPLRIAYYGDSFIEGDILVADLREKLQSKYGGNGVGWIDAGNGLNKYKPSVNATSSGLVEHMVMKKEGYQVALAGLAERYYPAGIGSTMTVKGLSEYPHASKWGVSRLYLRARQGATLAVKGDGGEAENKMLPAKDGVQTTELLMPTSHFNCKVSSGSPTLFGVALETDNGVVVDNFSMRGSSGITLSQLPMQTLSNFNRERPYDLIIFQFGVNAISASSGKQHFEWYMGHMRKVVELYKQCFPTTSILVMSTPDRGSHSGGVIGTMKGIETLVAYQEQLAADCHVGFYNLFEAMGGRGSMGKLCSQGMGSKDYVHISYKGGRHISQFIFNSFVTGQQNWSRRQKILNENIE